MQELVTKIKQAFQMNEAQVQELLGFPEGVLKSVWNSYKTAPAHRDDPGAWFIKICELRLRDRPDLVNPQPNSKKWNGKGTGSGESAGPRPLVKKYVATPETRTSEEIMEFVQARMLDPEMLRLQEKNPGLYNILSKLGKAIFDIQLAKEMKALMSDNPWELA